ncbi:MAG: pentapeptide repeat-containing protein [Gammaproteobacteria bacterium]
MKMQAACGDTAVANSRCIPGDGVADGGVHAAAVKGIGHAEGLSQMNTNRNVWALALAAWLATTMVWGQDLLQGLDLKSPAMTRAEVTREEVVTRLNAVTRGSPADFTSMRLSGLDLSGLDFKGAILRDARLNNANLRGANLAGAVLDQAWLLNADLMGANLKGASLFQAQLIGATLDRADLSGARAPGNFSRASLKHAKFVGASLGADMRNQSMGLLRGVFRGADLDGADFSDADLSRVDLAFASLRGANLTGADLTFADLSGADLTGATVTGANFEQADVHSAKLKSLVGAEATNLNHARNLANAVRG